jgi:ATP-dependent Clp protease adaptor protein ClpS
MGYDGVGASPQWQEDMEVMLEESRGYTLVVWNDDVNTFDWVIKALVDICGHSEEQAEQCALIIHTQGKYAVKNGEFEILKPMCEGLIDRGINATIEAVKV